MKSRHQHQGVLPPMEVRRSDSSGQFVRNSDAPAQAVLISDAAQIFEAALKESGLDNSKVVADLCGVSVSLVDKWRSQNEDRSPSFAQLLLLPPTFHVSLQRVLNRRYGYGRAALSRLLDAAGDLAVAMGL